MTIIVKAKTTKKHLIELRIEDKHYKVICFDLIGGQYYEEKSIIYGLDDEKKATATYSRYCRNAI